MKFENYRDTLQYLNRSVFQLIPRSSASGAPIRPGNMGRGALRAPGLWNIDLSIGKAFPIREKARLQVRADSFNGFNHTNLSGLRTSLNDSFFGQLLSTQGARVIQVGANLSF